MKSLEKKTKTIPVRVTLSMKMMIQQKGLDASYVARSAWFQALQQSQQVTLAGSKMRSKQHAFALFNALLNVRVRTISPEFEHDLMETPAKMSIFKSILLPGCTPQELIVLGEFLNQGEYAEEVLQIAFTKHDMEKDDFA